MPTIESDPVPTPSPATPGPRLTRRAALGAVVAGGLVACTPPRRGVRRREGLPEPVEPEIDPDVAVATEALAAQTVMIELVRATEERHDSLRGRLGPVLAAHEAHAALLSDAVPSEASATPSPPPSPSPSASGSASATSPAAPGDRRTRVPGDPARALRQVVAAEQTLATTTKRHAFRAQSGAFARVLGSMAAAAAQHAVVLEAAPAGRAS